MKAYGLRDVFVRFPSKIEHHMYRKFRKLQCWWEEQDVSKGRERQKQKKQIQKELLDL